MRSSTLIGTADRYSYSLSDHIPFSGEHYPRRRISELHYDMHYPLELTILLKGHWQRYYGDWTLDMTPGQVSFCGMWESHGVRSIGREPCDVFVLIIWPALLSRLHCPEAPDFNWLAPFIVPPSERPQVPADQRDHFIRLGRRFASVLKEPPALRMVWFRVLLMETLLTLSKTWRTPALPQVVERPFQQLNPVIEKVFGSHRFIPTREAARTCGMNRIQFSRFFRANMGLSFAEFSLRHRLDQAVAQMLSTPAPLKSIAYTCGFTDESHFHRVFMRHYRCTPAAYRKRRA